MTAAMVHVTAGMARMTNLTPPGASATLRREKETNSTALIVSAQNGRPMVVDALLHAGRGGWRQPLVATIHVIVQPQS